ncbi:hypothetical protein MC885_000725 [Smutsia gigantea]|nr:hypothetical protein MC885_000725 [Smutsia gigantea]
MESFVESELKKLLAIEWESHLWKMGGPEGQELPTQPEIILEEAGIVDGQVYLSRPDHHLLPEAAGDREAGGLLSPQAPNPGSSSAV